MAEAPGATSAATAPAAVELRGITKRFGSLVANDGVDLAVQPGEVHALLGENGAGKSTLTKVLYGLSQPDAGEMHVNGTRARFSSPKDAIAAGIGMVTQEFSLVAPMTVTENVMLATVGLGRVDRRAGRTEVLAVADRVGIDVDPDVVVTDLSVGERQRVEILKALSRDCRVLVLDEPTAVLVPQDVSVLFSTIRRLTAEGLAVIFISHKLNEVVEIADQVTVLRRGRRVACQPAASLDPPRIAALMVGEHAAATATADPALASEIGLATANPTAPTHVVERSPDQPAGPVAASLELRHVTVDVGGARRLDNVSIRVAAGEIVGVAGVSGNGQTELVSVLAGTIAPTSGTIVVAGQDVTAADPLERLSAGLGRITEDRTGSVVPGLSVEQNLVLEDLDRFTRWGIFTDRRRVREYTQGLIEEFDIRAEAAAPIRTLSGGNMQKVLLARALARRPSALVVAQPTRGLDVGACDYVYRQLRATRARGGGIMLISEDLDELFGLADRIVVIVHGRIVGESPIDHATRAGIGLMMTGETIDGPPGEALAAGGR